MKKSYQGYIESEQFGQILRFLAAKIAIEESSFYLARLNNCHRLNFFSKTA